MILALVCSLAALPGSELQDYVGRFALGQSEVVFTVAAGKLCVRPFDWDARQPLVYRSGDEFYMEYRTPRGFRFSRGKDGGVDAVDITGMDDNGHFVRLNGRKLPLELVLEGKPAEAEAQWVNAGVSSAEGLELIRRTALGRPSSSELFARFLEKRIKDYPDAPHFSLLGTVLMADGQRKAAKESYRHALEKDPTYAPALRAMRMFNGAVDDGWTVPFTLSDAFAPPTSTELKRIERIWSKRDLTPKGVRLEDRFDLECRGILYAAEVVSHLVHGQRHYGVILVPKDLPSGPAPLILELKGLNSRYSPLEIPGSSTALRFLESDARRFIFVLPSYRGERVNINGKSYTSEGDPDNSWDGATDDAVALLSVALGRIRNIDKSHIVAFGRSRGGTVAMLTGERDKRVSLVLAWSGPAGWIDEMTYNGWKPYDYIREGMRQKDEPNTVAGQAIRTFFKSAIEGHEELDAVRNRLIASSPVYFLSQLPQAEIWYGKDDYIVRQSNGKSIQALLNSDKTLADRVHVTYYDGGHDLDPALADRDARSLLVKWAFEQPQAVLMR